MFQAWSEENWESYCYRCFHQLKVAIVDMAHDDILLYPTLGGYKD